MESIGDMYERHKLLHKLLLGQRRLLKQVEKLSKDVELLVSLHPEVRIRELESQVHEFKLGVLRSQAAIAATNESDDERVAERAHFYEPEQPSPSGVKLNGHHTADSWNAAYPVGTPVRYWPVYPPSGGWKPIESKTRSAACSMLDGSVVVAVGDIPGYVHLSHLEVMQNEAEKPPYSAEDCLLELKETLSDLSCEDWCIIGETEEREPCPVCSVEAVVQKYFDQK